jgi:hypothetical protein
MTLPPFVEMSLPAQHRAGCQQGRLTFTFTQSAMSSKKLENRSNSFDEKKLY